MIICDGVQVAFAESRWSGWRAFRPQTFVYVYVISVIMLELAPKEWSFPEASATTLMMTSYVLEFAAIYFAPSFRAQLKHHLQIWISKFQDTNALTMSDRGSRSYSHRAAPYTPIRSVTTASSSNSNWSFPSIASSTSTDSTTFWKTPPKKWKTSICKSKRVSIPGWAFVQQ